VILLDERRSTRSPQRTAILLYLTVQCQPAGPGLGGFDIIEREHSNLKCSWRKSDRTSKFPNTLSAVAEIRLRPVMLVRRRILL